SHWRWMVALYIFVGGLAGALQAIALPWLLVRDRPEADALVAHARYLALPCVLAGAALLIADLKTPRRWYQMMRIYRGTSPMPIGSYVLVGFGALTGLLALMQRADERGGSEFPLWLHLAIQAPCALLGLLMASYPAPLLSATSTPRWARAPKLLAAT